MSDTPTLEEISRTLRAEMRAAMPGSEPAIWPNNLALAIKAMAPALHGLHGRQDWVLAQAFASQAGPALLDLHGTHAGVARLPATHASGQAAAATVAGTLIPAGTRLLRGDLAVFEVVVEVTASGASTTLSLRAAEPGKAGNTAADVPLAAEMPIDGLGAVTVGAAGLTGGDEAENDASFRERILFRKANPPGAGRPSEYQEWARRLPVGGVTGVYTRRAFPQPGSVTVYFMMHDRYADGIPLTADVEAMQAWLETQVPEHVDVIAAAPTAVPVDVTLSIWPDTATIRDEAMRELRAMFRRRARPGEGTGSFATPFVFAAEWVSEAVSSARGEQRHVRTAPSADVECFEGEIAVLGDVTWV